MLRGRILEREPFHFKTYFSELLSPESEQKLKELRRMLPKGRAYYKRKTRKAN